MNKTKFIHGLVSQHYGISLSMLYGPSRKKAAVLPRRIAMYLERTVLHHNYSAIGHNFNRDHSTVLDGVAKLALQFDRNPELKKQIQAYEAECAIAFDKPDKDA